MSGWSSSGRADDLRPVLRPDRQPPWLQLEQCAADSGWDSGLGVPSGGWSFAAVVIEPTRATVYLYSTTAQLAAAHSVPHAVQLFDGTTYIGTDPLYADGTRTFNGTIDEVSVWNRALSGDQIAALFTAGSGVSVAPSVVLQPVPTTIYVGKTNQLSMTAGGTGPYAYQWYTNGVAITNGGTSWRHQPHAQLHQRGAGRHRQLLLRRERRAGLATSSVVAVTVLPVADSPVFAAPAAATFANLTNQTGLVVGCEDFGATEYSFNVTNGAAVTTYDFKVDGSVASVPARRPEYRLPEWHRHLRLHLRQHELRQCPQRVQLRWRTQDYYHQWSYPRPLVRRADILAG